MIAIAELSHAPDDVEILPEHTKFSIIYFCTVILMVA